MQMSNTSELVPNHSYAFACAVGISRWFSFLKFLVAAQRCLWSTPRLWPHHGGRGCQVKHGPSTVEACSPWSRGIAGDQERSRQSVAPMGTFAGITARAHCTLLVPLTLMLPRHLMAIAFATSKREYVKKIEAWA